MEVQVEIEVTFVETTSLIGWWVLLEAAGGCWRLLVALSDPRAVAEEFLEMPQPVGCIGLPAQRSLSDQICSSKRRFGT